MDLSKLKNTIKVVDAYGGSNPKGICFVSCENDCSSGCSGVQCSTGCAGSSCSRGCAGSSCSSVCLAGCSAGCSSDCTALCGTSRTVSVP